MKYIMRNILVVSIVVIGLCLSSNSAMAAEPEYDVVLTPSEPERKGTVSFTATITADEEIQSVNLLIIECSAGPDVSVEYCQSTDEVEMILEGGVYKYEDYQLDHPEGTYLNYTLVITTDIDTYDDYEFTKVLFKPSSGNGGGDDGDDDNGSPGFELISLLIAISVGVFLLKRKRSR